MWMQLADWTDSLYIDLASLAVSDLDWLGLNRQSSKYKLHTRLFETIQQVAYCIMYSNIRLFSRNDIINFRVELRKINTFNSKMFPKPEFRIAFL